MEGKEENGNHSSKETHLRQGWATPAGPQVMLGLCGEGAEPRCYTEVGSHDLFSLLVFPLFFRVKKIFLEN